MKWQDRDPGAEVLLELDGQIFVVDTKGQYWVRFSVVRVISTSDRSHGLNNSLTLHGPDGSRLVGFDKPIRSGSRAGLAARAAALSTTGTGCRRCAPIGSKTWPHF
jgi:hypothetical protein